MPWLLGGALIAAVVALISAGRAARWWAPATGVALFLAGNASYTLHRARLPAWDELPPREARLSLRVDRVFPQADPKRATGLATIVRADDLIREITGQRAYFSRTLHKGETVPVRSAVVAAVGLLAPLARNPPADSFEGYLASAGMNFRLTRSRVLATEQPPAPYHAFLQRAATRFNDLRHIPVIGAGSFSRVGAWRTRVESRPRPARHARDRRRLRVGGRWADGPHVARMLFKYAAMVLLVVIERLIKIGVQAPDAWWVANWRAPWLASVALALVMAAVLAGYAAE